MLERDHQSFNVKLATLRFAALSERVAWVGVGRFFLDKTRAIKQGMKQQILTCRVRLIKPEVAA